MDDQTEQFTKEPAPAAAPPDDSRILNVSLRGWIAVIVVVTICIMSVLARKVEEPLYTLGGLIVGFYFGQNLKRKS